MDSQMVARGTFWSLKALYVCVEIPPPCASAILVSSGDTDVKTTLVAKRQPTCNSVAVISFPRIGSLIAKKSRHTLLEEHEHVSVLWQLAPLAKASESSLLRSLIPGIATGRPLF